MATIFELVRQRQDNFNTHLTFRSLLRLLQALTEIDLYVSNVTTLAICKAPDLYSMLHRLGFYVLLELIVAATICKHNLINSDVSLTMVKRLRGCGKNFEQPLYFT